MGEWPFLRKLKYHGTPVVATHSTAEVSKSAKPAGNIVPNHYLTLDHETNVNRFKGEKTDE